MTTLSASPSSATWARALLVLAATLLAHALLLERLQGSRRDDAPVGESSPINARLLPPEASPPSAMPQPLPAKKPRPRPAAKPAAATPPAPTVAAAPSTLSPPAPSAEVATAVETAPHEAPAVEDNAVPATAVNAEKAIEENPAVDAVEFDATGATLLSALTHPRTARPALPAAARYVYRTTNSELRLASGTTIVDWQVADDGRYRLRLTTTTLGMTLLELESTGTVRAFGLAPERYVETRVRRGAVAANFDWPGRRVTFSSRTHERPLADGVQDRVSFQFQLMLLGQALPARFKAERLTVLHIASRDDVSSYRLRSAGREATPTGIGELDTVKVERIVERDTDARIEVWLAPEHGWLPARLRFTDRAGRVTESVLDSMGAP